MNRMISRKSFTGLTVAVFATACLGVASWGLHKSSGTDVNFSQTAKFENGNSLPAGSYRMVISGNSQAPEVKFYKEYLGVDGMDQGQTGKPVVTIEAKAVNEPSKNAATEIDSVMQGDVQLVKSIRPAGLNEALVFGTSGANASAASNP